MTLLTSWKGQFQAHGRFAKTRKENGGDKNVDARCWRVKTRSRWRDQQIRSLLGVMEEVAVLYVGGATVEEVPLVSQPKMIPLAWGDPTSEVESARI